jgi:hypothetical protein
MRKITLLFILVLCVLSVQAQSVRKLMNKSYIVKTNVALHVNDGIKYYNNIICFFEENTITLTDGSENQTVFKILKRTKINKNEIHYSCYFDVTNQPVVFQVKKADNTFYVFFEITATGQLFVFKTDDLKNDLTFSYKI